MKLTDPVTAVLYITSDYQHMQELKHTIHVKEVVYGKNYYLLKYFHEKFFAIFVEFGEPKKLISALCIPIQSKTRR